MSTDDPNHEPSERPTTDPTGVISELRVRLDDFVDGDPPLPLAYLLVVTGPARGTTLVVDRLPVVVGRSTDADLVINDETVSRTHAELRGDRTAVELEDLGSSNGTTLQGNPIVGSLALLDGDLVGFGSAICLVKRIS